MADKLPLPNILDYKDSTGISIDYNLFRKDFLSAFNNRSSYDFEPYKDYSSKYLPNYKIYDTLLNGNSSQVYMIPIVLNKDFELSLNDPDYSISFNSFFENLKNSSNSNSNSTDFEFSINNIDLSVYFIGAGIIILALASIWASKRALGILK